MYLLHVAVAICVFGVIQGIPNHIPSHPVVGHHGRPNNNEPGQCPAPENVKCPPTQPTQQPLRCSESIKCVGNLICCPNKRGSSEGCCIPVTNLNNKPTGNVEGGEPTVESTQKPEGEPENEPEGEEPEGEEPEGEPEGAPDGEPEEEPEEEPEDGETPVDE